MADVISKEKLEALALEEEMHQNTIRQHAANYQWSKTKEARDQIEWFMDQKFGFMVHWGLYNQMGIKESWPLVDNEWSKAQFKPGTTNMEVKEMYAQLHRGFLPLRFDPQEWADITYEAGFRYLCFTTKHHDGFCMWDTKTTDYKVTGSEVPWRSNKNADITKALFDAFRAKGMGISAYYSRADFDCEYYWEPGYRWKDGTKRIPSYNPEEKPELWKKFQNYVFTQLTELCTNYGRIDCLWYDGGCNGVQLGLPEMTEELRKLQPWMLGVIRGGEGICEDIVTPESVIPSEPLHVPWELCINMGKKQEVYGQAGHVSWGYTYDQEYMTAKEVIHLLLDVVCKGGNLALNISPQPDGRLPYRVLCEMEIITPWMKIFADGIHGTRYAAPYRAGQYAFTQSKDGKTVNAFYLYEDGEATAQEYTIPYAGRAVKVHDVRSGRELAFTQDQQGLHVRLPEDMAGLTGDIADCFRITC